MFKRTKKQIEAVKMMSGESSNIMLYGGSRSGKSFIIIRTLVIRACKKKVGTL